MHHIYETKSFVLGGLPLGEADRQVLLYTQEFGLLRAVAQGLREIKSKLRYSLQPYSLSTVNLVRGRAGWRIVNAALHENLFKDFQSERPRLIILARIFSLLRRMLHGEEKNPDLFAVLSEGFGFLARAPLASVAEVELIFVLRILYCLGYVGSSPSYTKALATEAWGEHLLDTALHNRRDLVRSVNESLKASQL